VDEAELPTGQGMDVEPCAAVAELESWTRTDVDGERALACHGRHGVDADAEPCRATMRGHASTDAQVEAVGQCVGHAVVERHTQGVTATDTEPVLSAGGG